MRRYDQTSSGVQKQAIPISVRACDEVEHCELPVPRRAGRYIGTIVGWSKFRHPLLRAELFAAAALLLAGVVIGPLFMVQLPSGGVTGSILLLLAGAGCAALLLGPVGTWFADRLALLPVRTPLSLLLVAGVLAQGMVAVLTQPAANSDGAVYLLLSEKLANGLPYLDHDGHHAFWPPGLPLFMAPFVKLFGAGLVAIAMANIVLYAIGAVSAWHLGARLSGPRAALLSAFLFTLWPSRLLTAAVASKENMTIAAVLAGTALCVQGLGTSQTRKAIGLVIAAGLAFGCAALAQPGLLLFVLLAPLAYRHFAGKRPLVYLGYCAVMCICTALALAPWQLRNCAVFHGQFCGVSTNGGSVFYRANNPLATGEWTAEGEIPITQLPELEQNRLGFELGKRWIVEHPRQFVALAVRKLQLLMRDDRYGAYWAVLRGQGNNHEMSFRSGSDARLRTFHVLNWISWLFWALILAVAARELFKLARQTTRSEGESVLPLVYPLLYSAVVYAVFESDRRQHMLAFALLLVLAAAAMARRSSMASPADVLPDRIAK
jgi:hypothetical protein